jgi:hypothetical protein
MIGKGAVAFIEVTGECVKDEIARESYRGPSWGQAIGLGALDAAES